MGCTLCSFKEWEKGWGRVISLPAEIMIISLPAEIMLKKNLKSEFVMPTKEMITIRWFELVKFAL